MNKRARLFLAGWLGCLLLLVVFQGRGYLQDKPEDLAEKYPEIAGLYELAVPGSGTVLMQVYFKDGTLRTIGATNSSSTVWRPVEGSEPKFKMSQEPRGNFEMAFAKDEQGRFTRFRVVNDKGEPEILGAKKAALDDAKADPASPGDRQGYLERHYRKAEHLVPMRDGVRLFTQVYSPIDPSEPHPIILVRTPYGIHPYGSAFRNGLFPGLSYAKEGYIIVLQDIRGRAMSEGTFEYLKPYVKDKKSAADVDESSDAYDTVEWLLKNVPAHNGKVGVWGSSYPGFTAAMAAIDAHPAVRAVSPQAPMADLFLGDDGHHSGALYLAHYTNYLYSMGQVRKGPTSEPIPRLRFPTPDGYAFFLQMGTLKGLTAKLFDAANKPWQDLMAHESYDAYWKAHSIYQYLRGLKPAILVVGGWYDGEDLLGTLRIVSDHREPESRLIKLPRHGALDAQRLESPGGRNGGSGRLCLQRHEGLLPGEDRAALLQPAFKRPEDGRDPRGHDFRDWHRPMAHAPGLASGRGEGQQALPRRERRSRLGSGPAGRRRGLRRVRQRSGQARPVHHADNRDVQP